MLHSDIAYLVSQYLFTDTNYTNNSSYFVINLKIILMKNIIVIFMKKKEIQIIGFTIVQILVVLLIRIAFLGDVHISSLGGLIFSELHVDFCCKCRYHSSCFLIGLCFHCFPMISILG
jgi:hypothetical protein